MRTALSTAPCSTKYFLVSTKHSRCCLGLGTRPQADLSRVVRSTEHFSRTFYPCLIHSLILPVHALSGGLLCATPWNTPWKGC